MKRYIIPALILLSVGLIIFVVVAQGRKPVTLVAPTDPIKELGLTQRRVPSGEEYALVYVREDSPDALEGSPLLGEAAPPFSFNPASRALYLGHASVPLRTSVVILQESLVLDFLLDAQVALSTGTSATMTLRPRSQLGQYVSGPQKGQVREMINNDLRALGRVEVRRQKDGTVHVRYGEEQRELKAGESWKVELSLTSGKYAGTSTVYIHYYGLWSLSKLTYVE